MNSPKHLQTIFEQAAQGDEQAFNQFLESSWQAISASLIKLSGSKEEAHSLFISGMSILWEHFVIRKRTIPANINAYLYIVCKNEWLSEKKKIEKDILVFDSVHLENTESDIIPFEELSHQEEEKQKLDDLLQEGIKLATDKCKKIIELHLKKGLKLKEIWKQLGFESYQAIVQAKYNCKKRLGIYIFTKIRKHK